MYIMKTIFHSSPNQNNTVENKSTHMNWKIVPEVSPNLPVSNTVGFPASFLWGPPIKVEPCQIREVKEPKVVHNHYHHDANTHLNCEKRKSFMKPGSVMSAFAVFGP